MRVGVLAIKWWVILLAGACLAGLAGAAPPPVQDFYRLPALLRPVLSPDGRYVAAAIGSANGRKQLAVIDLENIRESKVIAGFEDADVDTYQWVNAKRLVFDLADTRSSTRWLPPGLWAINRDASGLRQLIAAESDFYATDSRAAVGKDRRLSFRWRLFKVLRDGSDDVVVRRVVYDGQGQFDRVKLARLSTLTTETHSIGDDAPDHAYEWMLDSQGEPVVMATSHGREETTYVKDGKGWQAWDKSLDFERVDRKAFWAGTDGRLLASARAGNDTSSLYEVDRSTLKLAAEPLVSLPGYDFTGSVIYDSDARRVLGIHYEIDGQGTVWFDAGMRKLQAEVDKLLPGTINRIDCERCTRVGTVLVSAVSDRQPSVYYLYRRDSQELQMLASSRPWIQPEQMGQRDVFRFAARDGLQIPVLVTQPAGKATAPRAAVVMVHDGPWLRGNHWAWQRDAQFLASRGFVVIEPEFRGSAGYGSKLEHGGWKQWGLAMQDDVADALQWAVLKGLVDPRRVCIAGTGYGGYATLMGMIKTPELYKCGFEWSGVADIQLMFSFPWSAYTEAWKKYGLATRIGDPVKDAQQLEENSPVAQASRLKRPLLMAYGGLARFAPQKHGEAFRDAASANKRGIELLIYPDEGDELYELKTQVDFWTRVEQFLDRNIGPGSIR